MGKQAQALNELAARLHLSVDEQAGILYGVYGGYHVLIGQKGLDASTARVRVSVSRDGAEPDGNRLRAFVKSTKAVTVFTQNRFIVNFDLRDFIWVKRMQDQLPEALDEIAAFLRSEGYEDCCQSCGHPAATTACMTGGAVTMLCETCYAEISRRLADEPETKTENPAAGVVGALMGSLIGVAVMLAISQLGYVAAISGVVMAVCTLLGYEKLAGRASMKGIFISCALILVMTYLGDRMDWAILAWRELGDYYGLSLFDAFQLVPLMLEEDIIDAGTYYGNLVLQYGFVLLGAVPTVRVSLKSRKRAGQASACYRLGSAALDEAEEL